MKIRVYISILCLLIMTISLTCTNSCVQDKSKANAESAAEGTEAANDAASQPTSNPVDTPAETLDTPVDTSEALTYRNLVDGEQISLEAMKGKVVIVDFWATWCPPCRMEIPGFIELYDEYKDKNVTIVGISVDRNTDGQGEALVKKFIEQNKINYPVIMLTNDLRIKYEKAMGKPLRSIPTTFVLNKKGEVANIHVGYKPKGTFEEQIKKLLAEG